MKHAGLVAGVVLAAAVGGAVVLLRKPAGASTVAVSFVISSGSVPVDGATITVGGQTMTTDASGSASFPAVQSGNQTVMITAAGFTSVNETVDIIGGNTYDVTLSPVGLPPPNPTLLITDPLVFQGGTLGYIGTGFTHDGGVSVSVLSGSGTVNFSPTAAASNGDIAGSFTVGNNISVGQATLTLTDEISGASVSQSFVVEPTIG